MRATIGGKRYDTDTARFVGECAATGDRLYCRRSGDYFVCHKTPVARSAGARGNPNLYIEPLGLAAARTWARANLSSIYADAEFRDRPERIKGTYTIDGNLQRDMRSVCLITDETQGAFVEAAIRERVERLKAEYGIR